MTKTLWQHQSAECKCCIYIRIVVMTYDVIHVLYCRVHIICYAFINSTCSLTSTSCFYIVQLDTHRLTLLIVLVIAPLTAYLYNRFIHQCMKARCIDTKRRMSQSALGRRMSLKGIRRRMPRFSTKLSSMSADNG